MKPEATSGASPMFTIFAAVPTTRRIVLNYVIGQDNQAAFTSKDLAACLLWVYDQGETRVRIDNGTRVVVATISVENLTPAMLDGLTDDEVDAVRSLIVGDRMAPDDAIKRILEDREPKLPLGA